MSEEVHESSVWRSVFEKLLFNRMLPDSPEGILRVLGFIHLYTASGIHIYAFMAFLERFALASKLPKFIFRLLGYGIVLMMWKLQGFRLGFARPLLTFLIRRLAQERGVQWRVLYPLAITFILDCSLHLEPVGRVHYYLAVGGGLLALDVLKQILKKESPLILHAGMALGSWTFTAIFDLWSVHEIAWMTPFYSFLTLPVISVFLYPFSVIAVLFAPDLLSWCEALWKVFLDLILSIPASGFTFSVISRPSLGCSFILSVFCLLGLSFLKSRKSQIFCVGSFAVLAIYLRIAEPGFLKDQKIVQIDVKQGDAFLIENENRTEMIDVGGMRAKKPAEWLLEFSKLGITEIDSVLLSHLDEDHVGALKLISKLIPIHCVQTHVSHWQSEKGTRLKTILTAQTPHTELKTSGCMQFVKMNWFASSAHRGDGNELMAGSVVELDADHAYFALGDGDESQENNFFNYFSADLSRYSHKLWKISHHGSRFSSGETFLKNLNPEVVLISVGKHNPYHHPHPQVLARLQNLGIPFKRTDEAGDLIFNLNGEIFKDWFPVEKR